MKKRIITTLVIVIVVAVAVVGYFTSWFGLANKSSSTWKAVFLANGQVYFGHLGAWSSKQATLTNVYYLQVNQNLQNSSSSSSSSSNQNLSLVKLGNELHGPTDKMVINADQILFVEDMKSDSKVVSAINDYLKGNK